MMMSSSIVLNTPKFSNISTHRAVPDIEEREEKTKLRRGNWVGEERR